MNKKINILTYLIIMLISSAISFFVFMLLLHTPIFTNINVYMYRGILLLFISTIFNIILLIILKNTIIKNIEPKDILSITLTYFSISIAFFTLVPVTVERSISVHMLYNIEKNEGMTKEEIQNNFINKYVIENDAFEKRIIEQEVTGSIQLDNKDNKYKLTNKGKLITNLFRTTAKLFNANTKLMD